MTQPALDFTAAPVTVYQQRQAELDAEARRLDTAKARVLARLREGIATNVELNAICYRYGARIHELQAEGYRIGKTHLGHGRWAYHLGEPA